MSEAPIRRVLMTCDTVGGVWTFALELAEALGTYGIEVLLASLGGNASNEQRAAARRVPNLLLAESPYKLEWMPDSWADVAASGEWLLHLAAGFQPDLVHLNSFGHGALPWRVPVVLTAHSCVLSWWAAVRGGSAPSEWNRYRKLVESCMASVDLVTAPTRAMLGCLEQHYSPAPPAAKAVPNGRREECFFQLPKEPFVLTAGRLWDEAKNVAAIARLAHRLKWPCYIAGEQRHPEGSIARFPGCEILGRLGPDELAGWYARASIYALPARYEPFGFSPLEAALSGCSLVLGDIQSLREVWGDAAIFVPPDDERALEAALTALIGNSRLLAQMAERSMARSRHFSPQAMAAGYLDAYQLAAARRLACAS
jgi:glycogen(starch) synthase